MPVTRNWPRPGRHAASTTSTSTTVAVVARPTATPGRRVRPASCASRNRGAPSQAATVSGVISPGGGRPSVRSRAPLRQIASMCPARPRTPGSCE